MSSGKLSLKIIKEFPIIEKISFELLIEAYRKSVKNTQYDLDWEEDQFTNYLINFMRESKLNRIYPLDIVPQYPLLQNDLPIDSNYPKTLPIIDIRICNWKSENQKEYFFEAKNLSEKNWYKKSGAKVDASSSQRRYIKTGIENFRTGRYYNGSLIGYILEGEIVIIIDKLNGRLIKDETNVKLIEKVDYIKDFSYFYESLHSQESKELKIKHIFLKF